MKSVFLLGIACMCSFGAVIAQTTLSGDHVITGDLDVGTTGTPGNLEVVGETGNSASPGLHVTGDGGVLFTGTSGVGKIPATGVGARFMWYPKKEAFRAGKVTDASWDDAYIGSDSTAFSGGEASGSSSFAAARGVATGSKAFAVSAMASGTNSSAFIMGVAYGDYSFSAQGSAMGFFSHAIGQGAFADGDYSSAFGWGTASGLFASASVFGTALGDYASASGMGTIAAANACTVVGLYNKVEGTESGSLIIDENPLFVVGNGSPEVWNETYTEMLSPAVYSNALTVYKNGNVKISKRQGDILMGEFGIPE